MRRKVEHSGNSSNSKVPLLIFFIFVFALFSYAGNDVIVQFESSKPSKSKGSAAVGDLDDGKRLPTTGPNFETYSRLGSALGRTCLHDRARQAVLESYSELHKLVPDRKWIYAETGWCWGGSFYPHKTHQNGMSIDFHVPVFENDEPALMPTWPWDGFGYLLDFNADGLIPARFLAIDFEAMGQHLLALDRAAAKNGLRIKRVIFAPELQKKLKETKSGKRALKKFTFSKKPSWVRHDEHYHVDLVTK